MFEVKNSIDWETAKTYFNDASYDVYFDKDDYTKFLIFKVCDAGLSTQLDEMFGGDWNLMDNVFFMMLQNHYTRLAKKEPMDKYNKENPYLASYSYDLSSDQLVANPWDEVNIDFNPLPETSFNMRGITKPILFSNASPNAPTVTHVNGASESKTDLRFDLVPAEPLATIAKILNEGAIKYGEDNWKGIKTESHINHAVQHLYAYLAGDRSDDHLGHAATRCMFAMWTDNKN